MSDFLLLDTDVASYLFKKSPRATAFQALLEGKQAALAFVSIAELFKWTVKRRWTEEKVEQLEAALRRYLVIPYDRDLAWAWARVVTSCEEAGRTIAPSDAWIAAAALHHRVPLLTNNVKHYEAAESLCGLQLLRPQSI
ncbi:MAG: type II toxin-antitoxin system VapC family toxin [Patescibacteria group bacterium]|nr:type II toxin-antitoxin system VapC family toxin [Patescibacteria group bacterium]